MANARGGTSAKFCPRCGAFYNDLPSKTCPQCFALLEVLSEEAAESLTAEQQARTRDPEVIARKLADDEKFKEQAFGGCLGVIGVLLITLILAVVIVAVGSHRRAPLSATHPANSSLTSAPSTITMPRTIAGAQLMEQDYLGSGESRQAGATTTYARYRNGIDVYATSAGLSAGDLRAFRRAADDNEDLQPVIHSRKELVAGGDDFIIFAPNDSLANQAAASLLGAPTRH